MAMFGLARVRHVQLDVGGLHLRLSVARPLSQSPPSCAMYILDPEPELFALATAHLFGRFGYDSDDADDGTSLMRRCAVVGIGFDPESSFECTEDGWNVGKLKELRRAHFLRDAHDGAFHKALLEHAVPRAEALLDCSLSSNRRALVGCSLTSLFALRTLLRSGDTRKSGCASHPHAFGLLVLGSPSLPLCPSLLDEAYKAHKAGPTHPLADVIIITGEREGGVQGNGIPAKAKTMAELLRRLGHRVSSVEIAGEDHGSLKPSLISRGVGFVADCWARQAPAGPPGPMPPPSPLGLVTAQAPDAAIAAVATAAPAGATAVATVAAVAEAADGADGAEATEVAKST